MIFRYFNIPECKAHTPLSLRYSSGAQWLSGRVLDWRPRSRGFKPHQRHCVVSLSKAHYPSLVLVQPRKTCPYITERLLVGHKESNQTNKKLLLKVLSNKILCDWHNYGLITQPKLLFWALPLVRGVSRLMSFLISQQRH